MNIISCHGFVKYSISTVILTCRNSLVPYYIFKLFVFFETEMVGVDNIPITVKKESMILIYMNRRVFYLICIQRSECIRDVISYAFRDRKSVV